MVKNVAASRFLVVPSRRLRGFLLALTVSGFGLAAVSAAPGAASTPTSPETTWGNASSSPARPIHRVEHRVPLRDGRWLFVSETFSQAARQRSPHRAVLFLSGSAFRGNHWTVPYPGYDAGALAAERGIHAFTVDYLGVGESFRPADGWEADFPAQVEAIGFLVDWIRRTRQVATVDLVGAGYGGGVAAELAADPERVRSVTMSAQLYRQVVAGPLLDEEFIAFLRNSPDGYFLAPADGASIFFRDTPLPVQDYLLTTQGGHYPVDNFLVATDRPFYDAAAARAPLLVLYGQQDFLSV